MNNIIFRSRISVMLSIIILLIIASIATDANSNIFVSLIIIAVIILIFIGIRYHISEGQLKIKLLGINLGVIKISEIRAIKRTYNPISSPAASLKRLGIYDRKRLIAIISPSKEQEFIDTLKSINPYIVVDVKNKKGAFRFWDWDI